MKQAGESDVKNVLRKVSLPQCFGPLLLSNSIRRHGPRRRSGNRPTIMVAMAHYAHQGGVVATKSSNYIILSWNLLVFGYMRHGTDSASVNAVTPLPVTLKTSCGEAYTPFLD
jgi:hypothetical protein